MANTKNYIDQGGENTVIGGTLKIVTGGKIVPNSGTQAATIATQTGAAGANPTQAEYATLIAAFNALATACINVGIISAT